MIIKSTKQKAFTLIETLVAISILMIAIAGPLTVANRGYKSALEARNQTVAMNLAQETIEYINYIKDNRDGSWGNWEPGTSFFYEVNAPYVDCVSSLNPCWQINGLPALPAGFFREYYFDVTGVNDVLLIVSIIWGSSYGLQRVSLTQMLTNQHR